MLFAATAQAFEVGDYKFRNSIKLFAQDNNTDFYPYQFEHVITISKKDFPFFLYNRYTVDYDDDEEDRYQVRTRAGYRANEWMNLLIERHEYSVRKHRDDHIVHRVGIEFVF